MSRPSPLAIQTPLPSAERVEPYRSPSTGAVPATEKPSIGVGRMSLGVSPSSSSSCRTALSITRASQLSEKTNTRNAATLATIPMMRRMRRTAPMRCKAARSLSRPGPRPSPFWTPFPPVRMSTFLDEHLEQPRYQPNGLVEVRHSDVFVGCAGPAVSVADADAHDGQPEVFRQLVHSARILQRRIQDHFAACLLFRRPLDRVHALVVNRRLMGSLRRQHPHLHVGNTFHVGEVAKLAHQHVGVLIGQEAEFHFGLGLFG